MTSGETPPAPPGSPPDPSKDGFFKLEPPHDGLASDLLAGDKLPFYRPGNTVDPHYPGFFAEKIRKELEMLRVPLKTFDPEHAYYSHHPIFGTWLPKFFSKEQDRCYPVLGNLTFRDHGINSIQGLRLEATWLPPNYEDYPFPSYKLGIFGTPRRGESIAFDNNALGKFSRATSDDFADIVSQAIDTPTRHKTLVIRVASKRALEAFVRSPFDFICGTERRRFLGLFPD